MGYETFVIYWMKEFWVFFSQIFSSIFSSYKIFMASKAEIILNFPHPSSFRLNYWSVLALHWIFHVQFFPLPFVSSHLWIIDRHLQQKKSMFTLKNCRHSQEIYTRPRLFCNLLLRPTVKKWASSSRVRKFKLKRRINISFHITCGHVGCQERMKYEFAD